MFSFSQQGSLHSGLSEYDEEKVIETALVTPYEKVMKILQKVVVHLETCVSNSLLGKEVDWVIQMIRSHKLYSYEGLDEKSSELERISKNSHEVQSFFGYLNLYSEHKESKRRDKDAKISRTTVVKDKLNYIKKMPMNKIETRDGDSTPGSQKQKEHSLFSHGIDPSASEGDKNDDLHFDDSEEDMSPIHKKCNFNKVMINVQEEYDSNEQKNLAIYLDNCNDEKIILQDYVQVSSLFEITFNVFDFVESVGIENVLLVGATELITNLGLNCLIYEECLQNFLFAVRDGYKDKDTPYHTSIHGLDVMQTLCIYISHSNMCELLALNDLDILALTIGSMVHDIGHPGYNNGFQVNCLTELAIVYNDKSVLENYHISQTFKILQKEENNIFKKLSPPDFRNVRKRMIEEILATDMLFHSKIVALVKNRLEINGIFKGNNLNKIIEKNPNSQNMFDDQQEILNFLIHIADISHNSKEFKISQKWTECLMNEFWKQGDYEREHNMQISFLCDRETADIPKSQIGFIKAIILPIFDILIDFLPDLDYYQRKVRSNLDEWSRIVKEREKTKEIEQLK